MNDRSVGICIKYLFYNLNAGQQLDYDLFIYLISISSDMFVRVLGSSFCIGLVQVIRWIDCGMNQF